MALALSENRKVLHQLQSYLIRSTINPNPLLRNIQLHSVVSPSPNLRYHTATYGLHLDNAADRCRCRRVSEPYVIAQIFNSVFNDFARTNTDGVIIDPTRSAEKDRGIIAWYVPHVMPSFTSSLLQSNCLCYHLASTSLSAIKRHEVYDVALC